MNPYDEPESKAKTPEQLQQEDDLLQLMLSESGRRFIWRLLGECRVFQSTYTGDHHTFFKEGARSIGLFLMAEINGVCPGLFIQMMQERQPDD